MPDIKSLSSDVRTFEFKRGDDSEVAHFKVDCDALTESYYRGVGERQAARLRAKGASVEEVVKAAEEETKAEFSEDGEEKLFTAEDSALFIEKLFENTAENIVEQKALRADMLSHGFLVDWDITSDGQPLPCTEENLLKYMSFRALEEIWSFCLEKTQTTAMRKRADKQGNERGSFA